MKCPYCDHDLFKVLDSRPNAKTGTIRRRRRCLACTETFTTQEIVVPSFRKMTKISNIGEKMYKVLKPLMGELEQIVNEKGQSAVKPKPGKGPKQGDGPPS